MNPDFLDFVKALLAAGARFLIVGAHAMAVHGVPRATGYLDLWIATDDDNAAHVWEAAHKFGAPIAALGISKSDLQAPGKVIQFGIPPRRLDVLTRVTGLDFETAWQHRVRFKVADVEMPFLGREDLITNKRASARPKDLLDADLLEKSRPR